MGCVKRIIFIVNVKLGSVIFINFDGVINKLSIKNMLICVSYVMLLSMLRIVWWLCVGWLLSNNFVK